MATIEGVEIDSEAIVVTAARSLTVLSAVVGGGAGRPAHDPAGSAARAALALGVRRWMADRT
ncbi:MAG: hypothetical protein EHM88_13660 [Candidatus Rokuibacteriota bacterium]|nr:MAG: hypothetical protein EHM88_13660 [Candidatus Rokubacteria bacterium]